jgi:signal peptidase II
MASKYRWFIIALLLSVALDQGTKQWARASLKPKLPEAVTVVHGFFDLRYSENPGSAFGLFRNMPGARYLLFAVGVGALFLVGSFLKKAAPDAARVGAELGLLAGGAIGNVIDRITVGRVTDFVVWKVGSYEWPTFNIADAALVVGVIGLLVDMRPNEKAAASSAKSKRKVAKG